MEDYSAWARAVDPHQYQGQFQFQPQYQMQQQQQVVDPAMATHPEQPMAEMTSSGDLGFPFDANNAIAPPAAPAVPAAPVVEEWVLTSDQPMAFEQLASSNGYVTNHRLALRTHHTARVSFLPIAEQPVDAERYQYVFRSMRRIYITANANADGFELESYDAIVWQPREGSMIIPSQLPPPPRSPASFFLSAEAAPPPAQDLLVVPAGPVRAPRREHDGEDNNAEGNEQAGARKRRKVGSNGATKKTAAKQKKKANSQPKPAPTYDEDDVIVPLWDVAKDKADDDDDEEEAPRKLRAPDAFQCKLCPKSAPKKARKMLRTKQGIIVTDPSNNSEPEPFTGTWGEELRHFQGGRVGADHMEAWNRARGTNLQKYVCPFPVKDEEGGPTRPCGFSHGRPDHVFVDHMHSTHNAEAPGSRRARTTDKAYIGRKKAAVRQAIVADLREELEMVCEHIDELEETLKERATANGTTYSSVHGLDTKFNWAVSFPNGTRDAEAVARIRRLARMTGSRRFRTNRPGTWQQVADDLEAGLDPHSRKAKALDFLEKSQLAFEGEEDDNEDDDGAGGGGGGGGDGGGDGEE